MSSLRTVLGWMSENAFTLGFSAFFIFLFAVFVPKLMHAEKQHHRAEDCVRVLECTDMGVERDDCDALFPNCTKLEAP